MLHNRSVLHDLSLTYVYPLPLDLNRLYVDCVRLSYILGIVLSIRFYTTSIACCLTDNTSLRLLVNGAPQAPHRLRRKPLTANARYVIIVLQQSIDCCFIYLIGD